jgi:hypothetical protein
MVIRAYCLKCKPHTNEDHSMTGECLIEGCLCPKYEKGEAFPKAHRPKGSYAGPDKLIKPFPL